METVAVLETLRGLGVNIWAEGTKLILEPGTKVPQELLPAIKENKDEIVGWLEWQFGQGDDRSPKEETYGLSLIDSWR